MALNRAATQATLRDPAFAPRLAITAGAIIVLLPLIQIAEFDPRKLAHSGNLEVMTRFIGQLFPIAFEPQFLRLVMRSTVETLALATAGTALAMLLALPLAILVSEALSEQRIGPARHAWPGPSLRTPVRWLLVLMRSIPEIVWALLFVRALGLGPAAGVAAIAIAYAGMLGKAYFEIFESGDTRAARAILEAGGGRSNAFVYGVMPVALPEMLSYTVYRWECAIRASVVMGFVGAGGLGQQMELSIRMLAGGEVATMLLAFVALVVLADAVSALLRRVLQ